MIFVKLGPGGVHGSTVVEGDAQGALTMFPVMVNADIFDADAFGR